MGLDERSLTIRFGVKDKDIIPFMKGVSKGVFSFVVKSMIRSYINNGSSCNLCSLLDNNSENTGTFTKNLSMGMEDQDIYHFIMEQEQNCRSDKVKDIIRLYIRQITDIEKTHNSTNSSNINCQKKREYPNEKNIKSIDIADKNKTNRVLTFNDLKNNRNVSEEQLNKLSDSLYAEE